MLKMAGGTVNDASPEADTPPFRVCPAPARPADCRAEPTKSPAVPTLPSLLLSAVLAAAIVGLWHAQRVRRRRHAYARVLDAADAFEARLRLARSQIDSLDGGATDPVRDALQEMLRQRLWLQQHGAGASVATLDTLRDSIVAAQAKIDRHLAQLAQARAAAGI